MYFDLNYALVGFFLALTGFAVVTVMYWNTKKQLAELIDSHQMRDVWSEFEKMSASLAEFEAELKAIEDKEACCKASTRR